MYFFIVRKLSKSQPCYPVVLINRKKAIQVLFQCEVHSFGFPFRLRVIVRREAMLNLHPFKRVRPKLRNELRTTY